MGVAHMSKAGPWRCARAARMVGAVSVALAVTGCESASDLDVFGIFSDDTPAATTAGEASVRARGDQETAAAAAQTPPSLSSVPPRPGSTASPEVRQRVVEGLVADRENARYSDQTVRLQGSGREVAEATPAAGTAGAPPPQIGSSAGGPTQIAPPPPPPQIAAATPVPEQAPMPSGPSGPTPSVQIDTSVIDGSTAFPTSPSRFGTEEQVATIHFAHSSSRLDARDKQVLAQVASAQRETGAEVIVIGHASRRTQQLDRDQHEMANFRISLARANRVAEQLIAMGVAREKVQVEAFADAQPVYTEAMPTGEAGNRRAEIYFRQ